MSEEVKAPLWFAEYFVKKLTHINNLFSFKSAMELFPLADTWVSIVWNAQKQPLWQKKEIPCFDEAFQKVMEVSEQFPTPALFLRKLSEIKAVDSESL